MFKQTTLNLSGSSAVLIPKISLLSSLHVRFCDSNWISRTWKTSRVVSLKTTKQHHFVCVCVFLCEKKLRVSSMVLGLGIYKLMGKLIANSKGLRIPNSSAKKQKLERSPMATRMKNEEWLPGWLYLKKVLVQIDVIYIIIRYDTYD